MLQVSDLKGGVHIVHNVHNYSGYAPPLRVQTKIIVDNVGNLKTNCPHCPHCPQIPRPSLLATN
jgi:hypothetical protein